MIYFVHAGESEGPIKIGYVRSSDMMPRRLRFLQVGNAEPLHLLALMPGDRDHERRLHRQFVEGRLCGEWFRWDTPGLRGLVSEALEAEAAVLASTAADQ